MFRQPKPKEEEKKPEAAKETAHKSDEKLQQIIIRSGGGPRVTRGLLTAADIITALQGGDWVIANLLNPHPVTQTTRTLMVVKPEREDLTSLGGVASPNNAGIQIIAGVSGQKIKVYDAGYHAGVDGLHYFYFGTNTTATTKRFCTLNKALAIHKSFVQPRIGASGDGLYLFSSVSETNMPYDVGYVQEA